MGQFGRSSLGLVFAELSAQHCYFALPTHFTVPPCTPCGCLQDAVPGGRSHGVVVNAQDYGVFVSFYGGVTGRFPWGWGAQLRCSAGSRLHALLLAVRTVPDCLLPFHLLAVMQAWRTSASAGW